MGRFAVFAAPVAIAAVLFLAAGGCGSDEEAQGNVHSQQSQAAVRKYREYLEERTADLVRRLKTLERQIEGDYLPGAQSTYSAVRVPYGHIKAAAMTFGDLDAAVDSLPSEVPAKELEGFHQIEKGLFRDESTAGLTPVAKRLLAKIENFQAKLKSLPLRQADLVESATKSLEEFSESAIQGTEEPYSELDMVDVSAGLEGAEEAYMAAQPPIEEADSDLAGETQAAFDAAYERMIHFGIPARRKPQPHPETPGTFLVQYHNRTPHEFGILDRKLKAVVAELSQAPPLLAER
jgi:iron uptake system component EfeO